jgi:DNA-binding NtrC family response regulator
MPREKVAGRIASLPKRVHRLQAIDDAVLGRGASNESFRSIAGQQMRRLLLVDDEPGITDFIEAVAKEQSFEVRISNRSTEFMESFRKSPPDAIILDLAIPGIDGVELLRWLAEQDCKARIVIISGFDRRVLDAAKRMGEASGLKIVGTLSKPIRLVAMRDALNRLGQGT